MADEILKVGVVIDSSGATTGASEVVRSFENIALAVEKAGTRYTILEKAGHNAATAYNKLSVEERNTDAGRAERNKMIEARAKLIPQITAANKELTDSTMRLVSAEKAVEEEAQKNTGAFKRVGEGAEGAGFHVGRMGLMMASMAGHAAGVPPIIDHIVYSMGSMVTGAAKMTAILAIIAAMAAAYQYLTKASREAEKAQDDARKAIQGEAGFQKGSAGQRASLAQDAADRTREEAFNDKTSWATVGRHAITAGLRAIPIVGLLAGNRQSDEEHQAEMNQKAIEAEADARLALIVVKKQHIATIQGLLGSYASLRTAHIATAADLVREAELEKELAAAVAAAGPGSALDIADRLRKHGIAEQGLQDQANLRKAAEAENDLNVSIAESQARLTAIRAVDVSVVFQATKGVTDLTKQQDDHHKSLAAGAALWSAHVAGLVGGTERTLTFNEALKSTVRATRERAEGLLRQGEAATQAGRSESEANEALALATTHYKAAESVRKANVVAQGQLNAATTGGKLALEAYNVSLVYQNTLDAERAAGNTKNAEAVARQAQETADLGVATTKTLAVQDLDLSSSNALLVARGQLDAVTRGGQAALDAYNESVVYGNTVREVELKGLGSVAATRIAERNQLTANANHLTEEAKKKGEEARRLAVEPFIAAVRGMQDAFGKTFESIFTSGITGFASFTSAIKKMFVTMMAQIAAAMTIKALGLDKLLLQLTESIKGGARQIAGASSMVAGVGAMDFGGDGTGTGGGIPMPSMPGGKGWSFGHGFSGKGAGFANAAAGLGAGLMGAGLGTQFGGNAAGGAAIGALTGAAAGFASGGPVGAIVGGVVGMVGGLLGAGAKAREAAKKMADAKKSWETALADFVAIAHPRGMLGDGINQLQKQAQELQKAASEAVGGDAKSRKQILGGGDVTKLSQQQIQAAINQKNLEISYGGSGRAARDYLVELLKLRKAYDENVEAIKKEIALREKRTGEDFAVEALRLKGSDAAADTMALQLSNQRQYDDMVKEMGPALNQALLDQQQYVAGLREEALAKRQAIEAINDAAKAVAEEMDLKQNEVRVAKDSAEQVRLRGESASNDITRRRDTGEMTPEMAERWFKVIAADVASGLKDIADAAQEVIDREAATAAAIASYNVATQADLQLRQDATKITEFSTLAERQAFEDKVRHLEQQRERERMVAEHASEATLAMFDLTVGMEDMAVAALRVADAAKIAQKALDDKAQAAREEAAARQDMDVRHLRALGQEAAADDLAFNIAQRRERADAVAAGRSLAYLTDLDALQHDEAIKRQSDIALAAAANSAAASDQNITSVERRAFATTEAAGYLASMNIYLREISYNTSSLRSGDMVPALNVGGLNYGGGGSAGGVTIVVNVSGDVLNNPTELGQAVLTAIDSSMSKRSNVKGGASGTVRVI
jgi:hypothetical protein